MPSVETLFIGTYGTIKSAKTTFGLTFPQPIVHFNLDQGFHRASHRFPNHHIVGAKEPLTPQHLAANPGIVSKDYMIPVQFPGMKSEGVLSLWMNAIVPELMMAFQDPTTRSVLIDTGTIMWSLAKDAQLERVQSSKSMRSNLIQIEYALPNQEMRALLSTARNSGKNIYITHHLGGIYKDMPDQAGRVTSVRVGDTWDGWSHLGAIVDVVGRTRVVEDVKATIPPTVEKIPVIDIETCGYTLKAEGISLPYPTFESVLNLINTFRDQDIQDAFHA